MIKRRRDDVRFSMHCLKAQKRALLEQQQQPAPSSKEVDVALSTPTPSTRRVSMNSDDSSFSSAEVDLNNFNRSTYNQDALSSSSSIGNCAFSRSCSSMANMFCQSNTNQDAFSSSSSNNSSSIGNHDVFSRSSFSRSNSIRDKSMWMPESQPNYCFSSHHQFQTTTNTHFANNIAAFSGIDAIQEELNRIKNHVMVDELSSISPSYASAPAFMTSTEFFGTNTIEKELNRIKHDVMADELTSTSPSYASAQVFRTSIELFGTDAIQEELNRNRNDVMTAELFSNSPNYASAPAAMISTTRSTPSEPIDSPNAVDTCHLYCQALQESQELLQADRYAQDSACTEGSPAIDWAEMFAGVSEWAKDYMAEINRLKHRGAPAVDQVEVVGPSSMSNGEKSSKEKKFGMVDVSDNVIREMFATL